MAAMGVSCVDSVIIAPSWGFWEASGEVSVRFCDWHKTLEEYEKTKKRSREYKKSLDLMGACDTDKLA
jgi:hypothetical protein